MDTQTQPPSDSNYSLNVLIVLVIVGLLVAAVFAFRRYRGLDLYRALLAYFGIFLIMLGFGLQSFFSLDPIVSQVFAIIGLVEIVGSNIVITRLKNARK